MAQTVTLPVFEIYGGAELWWNVGRDGAKYIVVCAAPSKDQDIRTMAFRQLPDGRMEPLGLGALPPLGVRASVVETADRAYVMWLNPGNRNFTVVDLPLYVPRGFGGTVAPPIPIQPTPPAIVSGPGSDAEARKGVADAQKALKALEARIKALEARPVAGPGLTPEQVDDRVWSKLPDAAYSALAADNGGLVGQIRRIVAPLIPTRETIRAIVRDVLQEAAK